MYIPTGDELLPLIGLSESDDKILDLFDKMDVKMDEIERDEDIDSFTIDYEDEYGFSLRFYKVDDGDYVIDNSIGGNYLTSVFFDYSCEDLPYGIDDEDNLEVVEQKIGKKANYINKDDQTLLCWLYEDIGFIVIEFQETSYDELMKIIVSPYIGSSLLDGYTPFKR